MCWLVYSFSFKTVEISGMPPVCWFLSAGTSEVRCCISFIVFKCHYGPCSPHHCLQHPLQHHGTFMYRNPMLGISYKCFQKFNFYGFILVNLDTRQRCLIRGINLEPWLLCFYASCNWTLMNCFLFTRPKKEIKKLW